MALNVFTAPRLGTKCFKFEFFFFFSAVKGLRWTRTPRLSRKMDRDWLVRMKTGTGREIENGALNRQGLVARPIMARKLTGTGRQAKKVD